MAGFYLIPLTMLALTAHERARRCGRHRLRPALGARDRVAGHPQSAGYLVNLLYGGLAGLGLVIAAYLIRRLSTISEYAILRAQLSEAAADILTSGGTRDDLDELLEYALERIGEQLDATAGVLMLLEDGRWRGRAGFGLGDDAGEMRCAYDEMALSAEALRGEATVTREFSTSDADTRPTDGAPASRACHHRAHPGARARDRRDRVQPPAGER